MPAGGGGAVAGVAGATAAEGSTMEQKRLALNLNVLKRHDPSITEIVESTSYVVLYRYANPDGTGDGEMQWTKTGVEGGMFLFKRSQPPYYGYFILNRHGIENYSDFLVDEGSIELTPEFIICQSSDDRIHGIWVFEETHRPRIGQRMIELCQLSKAAKSVQQTPSSSTPSNSKDSGVPGPSTTSPSVLPGQSISLDMLFGGKGTTSHPHPAQFVGLATNGNAATTADEGSAQPMKPSMLEEMLAGPSQAAPAQAPQGMALLDSLFGTLSTSHAATAATTTTTTTTTPQGLLRHTIEPEPSPSVSERLATTQNNINVAAAADETALKNLLGLSTNEQPLEQSLHPQSREAIAQLLSQPKKPESKSPQQPSAGPRPQHNVHPNPYPQQYAQQVGGTPRQQQRQQSFKSQPPRQASTPQAPAAPSLPNPHFVSAPLMPSVILNKNKSKGATSGQQSAARQAPITRKASGAPSLQQQDATRTGAPSVPPPPVPPVESRPLQSQLVSLQNQPSPGASSSSPSSLPAQTALDLVHETMQQTPLSNTTGAESSPNSPSAHLLDRASFERDIRKALQDPRFIDALYRKYVGSKGSAMP